MIKNKKTRRMKKNCSIGEGTIAFSSYCGGFCCEIASDNEARVYGVKCIVDYTPDIIVLGHKDGRVSFEGEQLCCGSYVEGAICIVGHIKSVRFDRK